MAFHPTNSRIVYAAGRVLWHSTDNGVTWAILPNTGHLPLDYPYVDKGSVCDDEGWNIQRFSIEVNENEPDKLWIAHTGQRYTRSTMYLGKLYEYTYSTGVLKDWGKVKNTGNNYHDAYDPSAMDCISDNGFDWSRARAFVVDKDNADLVHMANVNPIFTFDRSTGKWSRLAGNPAGEPVHNDVHHLTYDKQGKLWSAHDGGISVSNDNGATWHHKVMNMPIAMVYHLDAHHNNAHRLIYGCQDEGSWYYNNELNGNKWRTVSGGDGFECQYSQASEDVFVTSVNNTEAKLTKNPNSSAKNIKDPHTSRRVALHPTDKNVMFTGGEGGYKSANNGTNWEKILDENVFGNPAEYEVWEMYVSPANPNYLYAHIAINTNTSAERHELYYTSNWNLAAPTWQKITIPDKKGWFKLEMDNVDPERFWLSYGAKKQHNIYWYDGSNFHDNSVSYLQYVQDVEYEYATNRLFAIGRVLDNGSWQRGMVMKKPTSNWEILNTDVLPHCSFEDIDIVQNKGIIRIGLFGRGVWETSTPCYYDGSSTYTPADGAVINTSTNITEDIVIKTGRHVKIINCTLRMSEHASIIVEKGAVLEIDNATLTNACAGSQWRGIQVLGDPTKDMPSSISVNNPNYISYQGILWVRNSTIENAHEAFINHRKYNWGNDLTTVGGILIAQNTLFLNCWRSASFLSYTQDTYVSTIRGCDFLCTDDYIGLRSNENGYNSTISSFVSLWGVKGVLFFGNTFNNLHSAVLPDYKGVGVLSVDASYGIDDDRKDGICVGCPPTLRNASEFKNLAYGVKNHATIAALGGGVQVLNSTFTGVQKGIYDVGSAYSQFNGNTFTIPESTKELNNGLPYLDDAKDYTWGIFTLGSTALEVDDNQFTSTNTTPMRSATFGAVIRQSGGLGGEILRNEYTNVAMATQMEDYNLALKISCNEYNNYNQALTVANRGSDVYPPPPPTQRLADQGTGCDPLDEQADNTFAPCHAAAVQLKSATPFNYYDKDFALSNLAIPCLSPILSSTTIPCLNGLVPNCSPPSSGGGGSGGGSGSNASSQAQVYLSQLQTTSDPLQRQLLENKLMNAYMDDGALSTAIAYLAAQADDAHKKILVGTYLKNKEFGNCAATLASIQGTDDETQVFKNYYTLLVNACSAGRSLSDLTEAEVAQIEAIANTNTAMAYSGENMLRTLTQKEVNHAPYTLLADGAALAAPATSTAAIPTIERSTDGSQFIRLAPNPANSRTVVHYYVPADVRATLTLQNNLGNVLKSITLEGGDNQIYLSVDELEKGMYYLNMIEEGTLVETKKLMVF